MNKRLNILFFSLLCFSLFSIKSKAQNFFQEETFGVSLLRDTLHVESSTFGFNSVTLTNYSQSRIKISTKLNLPQGWTLLRPIPQFIELAAGESQVFTLRIRTSTKTYGGINYPVNLQLTDIASRFVSNQYFMVQTTTNSRWAATLEQNTLFAYDTDVLPDFKFSLKNSGNRVEAYQISFESNLRLTYPNSGFQLLLKPGQDTTIVVGIRSRNLNQLSDEIKIHINSRETNKIIRQKIYIISDTYSARPSKFQTMPMLVSWRVANLLQPQSSIQLIDVEGFANLENGFKLSYDYRSNAINRSYLTRNDFFQVNLQKDRFNISAGTQQDFFQRQFDGYGLRLDYKGNNSFWEVQGIQSRLFNGHQYAIRQENSIGEYGQLNTEGLYMDNRELEAKSFMSTHNFSWRKSSKTFVDITGGYSLESYEKIGNTFPGFFVGSKINLVKKRYSLNSNVQYYSKAFSALNRGLNSQNHLLRLQLGRVFIGAFANIVKRESMEYDNRNETIIDQFNSDNSEYGVQLGLKAFKGNLFLRLSQLEQQQYSRDNPLVLSHRLNLNYNFQQNGQRHTLSVGVMRSNTSLLDQQKDVMTFSSILQGKFKHLGYHSRFDYGPNFYFDFLTYSRNFSTFPFRHQHTVFIETNPTKKVRNRSSVNFFQMSQANYKTLIVRNDVSFDIPRINTAINIGTGFNLFAIKNLPQLNIKLTKALNPIIPFYKKYKSLKINLFKDRNNNNVMDVGEEPIQNANIHINNEYIKDKYLTTNEKGAISLQNVNKGKYLVNYQTIQNQQGWVAKSIIQDTIHLEKNAEVFIPFKKSKLVKGNIKVIRAPYSNNGDPQLVGIRILATNEEGQVFRSITNSDGEFFFNLHSEKYRISIPTNLYGDTYKFEKVVFNVDLSESDSQTVQFILKEKFRKINIKRLSD